MLGVVLALGAALALATFAACAGEVPPEDPDMRPPFPPFPPPAPLEELGRCEDGALYHIFARSGSDEQPPHYTGAFLGRCPGACGSAVVTCTDGACSNAAALCDAPPARGKVCSLEGNACIGTATVDCLEATPCSGNVMGSTCTCTGGAYACTRSPELAAVHASLVGKWRGLVDPPEFSSPYEVSLWIYPDGTYWAECVNAPGCAPFYYGGIGPLPVRTLTVAAAQPAGAYAELVLFHGQQTGAMSNLVVAGNTLTFTYRATWQSCEQPFSFMLARE